MRKFFVVIAMWLVSLPVIGQEKSNPVLFTYGKDTVLKDEFIRIYSKNNNEQAPTEASIKEYLDLYINFKLKVKEAKELGYDTSHVFKEELAGYRRQLAQSYLVDKEVTDKLVNEAYDRMKTEVNASHILVRCEETALPKDTVAAYNKIRAIRNQLLGGIPMDSLAPQVSEDPSARQNKGNLGWFSAFQMIYAFETGAYKTPIGQISEPIRSRFGYHLILVTGTRPHSGEVKLAHILIRKPTSVTPEQLTELKSKVNAIHDKIKAGESFEAMVEQYSEDQSTVNKKGVIDWVANTPNIPESFTKAAFSLENNGDVSEPVETRFGWHIIKLLDKRGLKPLEDMRETIKAKIMRDTRSQLNRDAIIERVKKENNFTENPRAFKEFQSFLDSNLLKGTWKKEVIERKRSRNLVMFTLGDSEITQLDFADYVQSFQTVRREAAIAGVGHKMYQDFVKLNCIKYEEEHLEEKYEDFRNLMQEYRDGILLFDLTDERVWSKAVNDTSGLESFHELNKQNYMWGKRIHAATYDCANAKVAKSLTKKLKKGKTSESEIVSELNKDNPLNVVYKEGKYSEGENPIVEKHAEPGTYQVEGDDNKVKVIVVKALLPAQPKALNEARGIITADFQDYLEKEWLKELRGKYPVFVNDQTVQSLYSN